MFTWVHLSLKFLYSLQQKLYLLVQKTTRVDSFNQSSFFPPLDLGKEWNEVMGRESFEDFQRIWYVVKTCDCLGRKQNIKKLKPKSLEETQSL